MSTAGEPLRATFFALKPRGRAVLLPATLVLAAICAVLIGAFLALNWGTLSQFVHMMQTQLATVGGKPPVASDDEALRLVGGVFTLVGSTFLLLIPLYIAVAAYEAACLRWMIRGEAPGFFGLTLDHDTWRVYGVYWCWVVAQWVVSTVVSVVTMPLMFASMGEVMTHPNDMDALWRWQMTVQLPIALLTYIPLIYLGVRFGPAAATSIARRRFSFFEAWTVTKRRFWELLGSFALLWAIWFVVLLVVSAPLTLRMWPSVQTLFTNPSQEALSRYFATYFAPESWLWIGAAYGVMVVGGSVLAVMMYGVNARAALAALEEGKISAPTT